MKSRSRLILELAKREITDRYNGQILGPAWMVGHSFLLMGVYVFIFDIILKVRVQAHTATPVSYTIYILSGLIPWLPFMESLAKSTSAVSGNPALVKQMVFPIEILPIKTVFSSLFAMAISLIIFLCYLLATTGRIPAMSALLPVLIFFQVVFMLGISFFVSSVAVYVRDLKDVIQVFSLVAAYMMPIFFLPDSVPGVLRYILYVNPFSYMIWCYQDIFYFGHFAHPESWIAFPMISIVSLYVGLRTFRKLKIMFGNVL